MNANEPVIGLWIYNISHPLKSMADWADLVAHEMKNATARGADILMLPEYAAEAWLHFAPADLPETQEIPWMAQQAPDALSCLRAIVEETGVALVAGSMPWDIGMEFPVNRAVTLLPGRADIAHDKLVLTPFEKDKTAWELTAGGTVRIFDYKGVKYAVLICLDIEMPYLSYILGDADIDVLLVPSQTSKLSGYHRVYDCAKARAIEMMCAVAVVGCAGGLTTPKRLEASSYISGASVYLPCEESLGMTGVLAQAAPRRDQEGAGEVVYAPAIPVAKIRESRHKTPEAWPGKWYRPDLIIKE